MSTGQIVDMDAGSSCTPPRRGKFYPELAIVLLRVVLKDVFMA